MLAFYTFLSEVIPDWNSNQVKFSLSVTISEYLTQEESSYTVDGSKSDWYEGCCKNIDYMLAALVLLEEAKVSPEDLLDSQDKNILLFSRMWSYVREFNPVLTYYHERLYALKEKETWVSIFEELFHCEIPKQLVLHGFYYITPMQQQVFDCLEAIGIQLIYLIPYNNKDPWMYEIWQETYFSQPKQNEGFTSANLGKGNPHNYIDYHSEQRKPCTTKLKHRSVYDEREAFQEELCLTHNQQHKSSIIIQEYASPLEFVKASYQSKKQGYKLYSSNEKEANRMLQEYYPEEYGERRLLSYPIGQFISLLHTLWDDKKNRVSIPVSVMSQIFATGWLAVDGVSAKSHLQAFSELKSVFHGCVTLQQWNERMQKLQQVYDEVLCLFECEQQEANVPYHHLSFLCLTPEVLDFIFQYIHRVFEIAHTLYDMEHYTIVSYMKKLEDVLFQYEISDELYHEERVILEELFQEIGKTFEYDIPCRVVDLSSALHLYMDGKLSEAELQPSGKMLVAPLYQVEASHVKSSKIHICYADVEQLPGAKHKYIWPLTERELQLCYDRTKNPYLKNLMYIMDSAPLCNRYFTYEALKGRQVMLSWIKDTGYKKLAPSPYIKMLLSEGSESISHVKAKQVFLSREYILSRPSIAQVKPFFPLANIPKPKVSLLIATIIDIYVLLQKHQNSSQKHQSLIHEVISHVCSLDPALRKYERVDIIQELAEDHRRLVGDIQDLDLSYVSSYSTMEFWALVAKAWLSKCQDLTKDRVHKESMGMDRTVEEKHAESSDYAHTMDCDMNTMETKKEYNISNQESWEEEAEDLDALMQGLF